MKPIPRCNMPARHTSPMGFRRCPACLDRYGREGFAAFDEHEPHKPCDQPIRVEWVEVRRETAYGGTFDLPNAIRVF